MTAVALVLGVVLLLVNAVLVALQFAHVATRRTTLERLAADGDRRARRVLGRDVGLDRQLSTSQLGITVASLALGAVAVPALAGLVESGLDAAVDLRPSVDRGIGVGVALVAVVLAHVVVGELVPKGLAITRPEAVLLRLASVDRAYTAVVGPPARLLDAAARVIARLLGVRPGPRLGTAHSAEELARLLGESRRKGILEATAHDLLAGALDLGGRDVGSVLVPADQVVSVPRTATVAEAEAAVVAAGVTRLLVREASGAVIGFVHAKDLLTVPADARRRPLPVARIRRVPVLTPGLALDTVLVAMRRSRTHVAAVVDGERRFVGIVTLEDVLGAVVGGPT